MLFTIAVQPMLPHGTARNVLIRRWGPGEKKIQQDATPPHADVEAGNTKTAEVENHTLEEKMSMADAVLATPAPEHLAPKNPYVSCKPTVPH